jgi:AcrR family transcriptional regulator
MRRRVRTAPRKQPKQERARETVAAILTATARILVRDGFEGASTNRIADEAGVSVGSLYQYFPSKEALIKALLERHIRDMYAVLEREMSRLLSLPLRQAVRELVQLMISAHAIEPKLHRVFAEEVPRVGPLERIAEVERRFEKLTQSVLERLADRLRPRNLEIAAFVVVQSVEALTHAAVLYHPEKLANEEFVDEVVELVVRYLAA